MKLSLSKPLVIFDLETTGVDIAKDRIVQIAMLKIMPDGTQDTRQAYVNPGMPIPPEASAVHNITDETVRDSPRFSQIAKNVHAWLTGCDYAGYNIINFDIPMLNEEFLRCNLELPKGAFIDSFNIFRKKEERTLAAAVKFYLNEEMVGAHDAMNDVVASLRVLAAQTLHYDDLPTTADELAAYAQMSEVVDYAGWFTKDADGDYIYNRGKAKGTKVRKDQGFATWMLKQNFLTLDTQRWTNRILQSINNGTLSML